MITLAIPFYRSPELLRQTLKSVQAQTSPDWCLVVVDNSPSRDIAEAAWQVFCEVGGFPSAQRRWVREPRPLSIGGNWNRCLEEVQTDWVTLLHADDELGSEYVRVMQGWIADRAQEASIAGFFCGARWLGPLVGKDQGSSPFVQESVANLYKARLLARLSPQLVENPADQAVGRVILKGVKGLEALVQGQFIICPTLCFRTAVLRELGGFSLEHKMVLDLDLFSRLLWAGRSLVGFPRERLYHYRIHAASATAQHTQDLSRFIEERSLYEAMAKEAQKRGHSFLARKARAQNIIQRHLLFLSLKAFSQGAWFPSLRYLREWRRGVAQGAALWGLGLGILLAAGH